MNLVTRGTPVIRRPKRLSIFIGTLEDENFSELNWDTQVHSETNLCYASFWGKKKLCEDNMKMVGSGGGER